MANGAFWIVLKLKCKPKVGLAASIERLEMDSFCYAFTATKAVYSMSIGCPAIALPGDEVKVIGWFCPSGPTAFTVNGKEFCTPFSWLVEMGGNDSEMRKAMRLI